MASDGLRSVGGLQVASGWLMQTPLGLFVLASGWLVRSQWVVTQILLALFVLCYSQWVAYVDFIGYICYSQCVLCADPLTLCSSQWVACAVPFSFI